MTQGCFNDLEKTLASLSKKKYGWSERTELLVFMFYMNHNVTMRLLAKVFDLKCSTVCDIIHRQLDLVVSLAPQVIKLPSTVDELEKVANGFRKRSKTTIFNGCVGALDGTLIPIYPSANIEKVYRDRKKQHSINLTLITDSDCKILYANAGRPGSVHDSRVFRESRLYLEGKYPPSPSRYYLLADKGYRLRDEPVRVITPYGNRTTLSAGNYHRCSSVFMVTSVHFRFKSEANEV